MLQELRPALVMTALFTLLTGIALPLAATGLAGAVLPYQAGGSLVEKDGKVIGSALLGQSFASPRYFQPRPSATTETDPQDSSKQVPTPYAADSSGGSNLGPTSSALVDRVKAAVAAAGGGPMPGDSVTTSASGLDPDISPENAARQVARVARERGMPEASVQALVAQHTQGRLAGLIGEPRVNVLALNMALDGARPQSLSQNTPQQGK